MVKRNFSFKFGKCVIRVSDHREGRSKNRYFCLSRSIAPKPFVTARSFNDMKYARIFGLCNGENRAGLAHAKVFYFEFCLGGCKSRPKFNLVNNSACVALSFEVADSG